MSKDIARRSGALGKWWVENYPNKTYGVQILQAFHAGAEHEQSVIEVEVEQLQEKITSLVEENKKLLEKIEQLECECNDLAKGRQGY